MNEVVEMRHTLIHGALSMYNPKTRKITFHRMDQDKVQFSWYTRRQLTAAHDRCIKLGSGMLSFCKTLADEFVNQD